MFLTAAPGPLSAAQYSVRPTLDVRPEYDSNPRLVTGSHDSAFGGIVDVGADLERRTETTTLRLTPLARFRRFDSEEDLDSDDQFLDLQAVQTAPRLMFGLTAGFARDSTLTSEVTTIGEVFDRRRRIAIDATPSVGYELSPRSRLEASYTYTDVDYDKGQSVGLFDFMNHDVDITIRYSASATSSFLGRVFAARFDSEEAMQDTDTLALTVGYTKEFSETFEGNFEAGAASSRERTTPFGVSVKSDSLGPVFDVSLVKEFERTSVRVGSAFIRSPTGQGRVVERLEATASINHEFTPLWSAQLDVLAFRNRGLNDPTDTSDADFISGELGVGRQLTERWTISGSYRYRRREEEVSSATAESHAVFLTLRYRQ
ncbi:MAG: hypothetical protein GWN53_02645 [Gammaproteobacteria bacterium]|nr:hypothetical protein [Gammaproteobacteria bacterium]NIW85048.1 hypothetical protein [Gammaproteobacteria bacterium]